MSNGGMNNNNYNYSNGNSNNNNGEEISNTSATENRVMSKIVGKFPLDSNGIASTNPLFSSNYIKPANGLIVSYTPSFVSLNSWKKNDGHHEVMDQWELFRRRFFF